MKKRFIKNVLRTLAPVQVNIQPLFKYTVHKYTIGW